jgi:hypothetical protein
VQWEPGLFPDG